MKGQLNQWQRVYCKTYFNGNLPNNKTGKHWFQVLGKIKSQVIVDKPDFNGINGFVPAHTETYVVTENECDMPNGKFSVSVLAGNLDLWTSRGYKITTK